MENNKQLKTLRILLERNRYYKVKSGYDGSKILTQWDQFGKYQNQNQRQKYIVKISWDLISLGKSLEKREEMINQYGDSNVYLYQNRKKIINYWLTQHSGSDFLLTLIVMFLYFSDQLSLLDEYNIKYQNIFNNGQIKPNLKFKYGEITKLLSLENTPLLEKNMKNKANSPFSKNINDLFVTKQKNKAVSKSRSSEIEEKITQASKENGDLAEQNTFAHMKKAIKEYETYFCDLVGIKSTDQVKIEDTFRKNSNAGYDILITKEEEPYASFEVKSIISTQKGNFFISANELKHLQSNDFHKFLVLYKSKNDIRILKSEVVMNHMEKKPVSYKVVIRK